MYEVVQHGAVTLYFSVLDDGEVWSHPFTSQKRALEWAEAVGGFIVEVTGTRISRREVQPSTSDGA